MCDLLGDTGVAKYARDILTTTTISIHSHHVTLEDKSPTRAGFQVSWALGKSASQPHSPHSHKFKVSGNRLPLSCFELRVRGLLIWHFWQADLELA
jgi:hypothetical protein